MTSASIKVALARSLASNAIIVETKMSVVDNLVAFMGKDIDEDVKVSIDAFRGTLQEDLDDLDVMSYYAYYAAKSKKAEKKPRSKKVVTNKAKKDDA